LLLDCAIIRPGGNGAPPRVASAELVLDRLVEEQREAVDGITTEAHNIPHLIMTVTNAERRGTFKENEYCIV
jgi:hypothetical protein